MNDNIDRGCAETRELLQRVLDGERLDGGVSGELDRHLADCAGCRETQLQLAAVQQSLRAIPPSPLPDDVLQAVLARTSRRPAAWAWLGAWSFQWRAAAVAAMLGVAVWAFWPTGPSQSEIEQATLETRLVLGLAGSALERGRDAMIDDVLNGKLAPALRRVPIKLPHTGAQRKRSQS